MAADYTPKKRAPKGKGRRVDPNTWITGPDPYRRNKYYAYLKHRSQARYRGESYSLTWPEWETLWRDDLWDQRGKGSESLCLAQCDVTKGWHVNNVEIIPRREQVSRTHYGRKNK
jgi:hypothetical protein